MFGSLVRGLRFLCLAGCGGLLFNPAFVHSAPWHDKCRQMVIVITPEWRAPVGRMAKFEFTEAGWKSVGNTIPVTVGKNGLGWGLGLHGVRKTAPQKKEGDRRAPAGVFPLEFGFGAKGFSPPKFPYRQAREDDVWVDDPASRYYNQWVRAGTPGIAKDWQSAEVLKRSDGIYDFAVAVGHNRAPAVKGRGSAIFIHSWYGPGISTIGCTAMEKAEVKALLKWLNADLGPVLVQLPRSEWDSVSLPEGIRGAISVFD